MPTPRITRAMAVTPSPLAAAEPTAPDDGGSAATASSSPGSGRHLIRLRRLASTGSVEYAVVRNATDAHADADAVDDGAGAGRGHEEEEEEDAGSRGSGGRTPPAASPRQPSLPSPSPLAIMAHAAASMTPMSTSPQSAGGRWSEEGSPGADAALTQDAVTAAAAADAASAVPLADMTSPPGRRDDTLEDAAGPLRRRRASGVSTGALSTASSACSDSSDGDEEEGEGAAGVARRRARGCCGALRSWWVRGPLLLLLVAAALQAAMLPPEYGASGDAVPLTELDDAAASTADAAWRDVPLSRGAQEFLEARRNYLQLMLLELQLQHGKDTHTMTKQEAATLHMYCLRWERNNDVLLEDAERRQLQALFQTGQCTCRRVIACPHAPMFPPALTA